MVFHRQILVDLVTPIALYHKINALFPTEPRLLFESAISAPDGNFSFIYIGAREKLWHIGGINYYLGLDGVTHQIDEHPFVYLKTRFATIDQNAYKAKNQEIGTGFSDGFVGYIGYESMQFFEPSLAPTMQALKDELGMPDVQLLRPRLTLVFSHKNNRLTLMASDEKDVSDFERIIACLQEPTPYIPLQKAHFSDEGSFGYTKAQFFEMVDASKKMITSGDVFQILMSNRYTRKGKIDKLSFYRLLRSKNPSPYLFLMDYQDFALAGSSPEVMVALKEGEILLRPIAGTRKRGKNPQRDLEMEAELLGDIKERAEHLMLVDLGRNDVGRVARAGTVKVSNFMHVERYSHVMHIVSDVRATIDEKYDMFDLFAATFTAGTMTGAPKIRAMELIAQIEGVKRNYYSGSVGYFGFDGNMDSAIAIRTALIDDEKIVLQAGAGIVADSIPELEYLEVTNKLGALVATLQELEGL